MSELIYCDQAATSFPKPPEVIAAMERALRDASASPGRSAHRYSLAASRIVFEAREAAAELLGIEDSSRVAFTLNVTQALNTVLFGLLPPGSHVLTTGLEHNSVMRPLHRLAETGGVEVEVVPGPQDGPPDPEEFRKRLKPSTRLAVVNHASNVVGTICPAAEIKTAIEGVPLLVDAAQSAGVLDLTPVDSLSDLLAFTGHKSLLGPTGTGGLWVSPRLDVPPLLHGGTGSRSELEEHPDFMPDTLEAGTPNTHGLAGLSAGIRSVLEYGTSKIREHEMELTAAFLDGLAQIKTALVPGPRNPADRVGVVSLNLDGWSPSDLALTLDREYGILTRSGLHCAPRAHRTLGTFPMGTVRFSFGLFNRLAEIDTILTALDQLSRRTP